MSSTSNWAAVLIKCRYEPRIFIILLSASRFLVALWPQTGYLHPDEFFQGPDIIAGTSFKSKITLAWEYTTDKPIRCMLVPYAMNTIAFALVKLFQKNPTAYLLLVVPRLVYTLSSFLIDFSFYKLCRYYSTRGLWYLPVSIVFQSSFACLGLLTRTSSNTTEVVIFALLLVVLCQALRKKFRIVFITPGRSTPIRQQVESAKQIKSSVLIGILTILGIFNRPTFVCFAVVPLLFWIKETFKMHSLNVKKTLKLALVPLSCASAITCIAISAFDTIYYRGFDTLKDLLNLLLIDKNLELFYLKLKSDWVLTPYNYIAYNTNIENLAQYGLHLPFTHACVNIPLLFSILGFSFYKKVYQIFKQSLFRRLIFTTHRMYSMMIFIVLISTIMLSFIPHQEFRFLLPLIIPLVHSFAFNTYASKRSLVLWLAINFTLVFFYTSVHQSGVIRATLDLDPILKRHKLTPLSTSTQDNRSCQNVIRVSALGCYMAPSYLWNIHKDDPRFELDVHEKTFKNVETHLKQEIKKIVSGRIEKTYLMMPSVYKNNFHSFMAQKNLTSSTTIKELQHYSLNYNFEHIAQGIKHFQLAPSLASFKEGFGFSLLEMSVSSIEQET